jgi:flagellar biosynthesis protein FlhG
VFLAQEIPSPHSEPQIIVVGGGKGGVGKSCVAVNLATEIASRGKRVVIVDADLDCSNVETLLGMPPHEPLDSHFRAQNPESLHALMVDTPYPNLKLIPGTTGLLCRSKTDVGALEQFRYGVQALDADVVIVDLDAGTRTETLDLFLLAPTTGLVVITPEKTSIDNAYKFVRAVLYRRIEQYYQCAAVGQLLQLNETLPDFLESVAGCTAFDRALRDRIVNEVRALAASIRPQIIVNRAHNAYEAQVAANILSKYVRDYLLMSPDTVGHLLFDKRIPEAVNSGVPFVKKFPKLAVTRNLHTISNRLGYMNYGERTF